MNRSEYLLLSHRKYSLNQDKVWGGFVDNFGEGKHNIKEEINYAKKGSWIDNDYASLSLRTVWGEFVFKDRLTNVENVTFTNNRLTFQGDDLIASTAKVAGEQGRESRAHYEYLGLQSTNEALVSANENDTVILASPPKVAGYGFLFLYQKLGNGIVKEKLIRYDETMGSVEVTQKLLTSVGLECRGMTNTNDFVSRAFLVKNKDLTQLESRLLTLSASKAEQTAQKAIHDVLEGKYAKFAVEYQLSHRLLKQYSQGMNFLLRQNGNIFGADSKFRPLLAKLAQYRDASVALAAMIASGVKQDLQDEADLVPILPKKERRQDTKFDLAHMALMARTMRFAASDCDNYGGFVPRVMPYSDFLLSGFNFFDFWHGVPMPETATHYESYRCPNKDCGKWLSGEKKYNEESWRKECPHCLAKINCKDETAESETVESQEGVVVAG